MHGHEHRHDHGPAGDPHDHHAHTNGAALGAFRTSTLLNVGLVVAEAAVGLAIGSLALLADAGHNLSDVLGLMLAWGAARLAQRAPSQRHTYGYARSTILAALLNAALLLAACGALGFESVRRIADPADVPGGIVAAVAAFALAVNAGSAALFWRRRKHDLNARAAYLHLVADAAISLGVIVAGGLIWLTGWRWIDPVTGFVVSIAIFASAWHLMREALSLALDAVPRGVDLGAIRTALLAIPNVRDVHDLHVWPLSTTVTALTAHLEHDGTRDPDALIAEAQRELGDHFGIHHTTIQLENVGCGQAC
ncbi:MAG TPA: cation diffusion facilitator family transporter [Albitalea sp.]